MYPIEGSTIRDGAAIGGWRARRRIAPTVWLLGLTSLFTDMSSEMVSSVLPAYLVLHLRFSPLQFGILDGLYQGVTAFLRPVGGVLADRWRRHKEVAAAGYLVSALCKLGLIAAGSTWGALASVITIDRAGKGLRTAPRDAMISLSSAPGDRATVFGLHRALDAAGAMLGPLCAFGLLAFIRGGFDVIFVTSFSLAMIGLGILVLLVTPPQAAATAAHTALSLRSALAILAGARFRTIAIVGGLLSLMTISDGFLYLRMVDRFGARAEALPLMYVGTSLAYLLLAAPAGWLADRWGRGRVLLIGYGLLGVAYAAVLAPVSHPAAGVAVLALLGAYYAATDGVLVALTSTAVPPAQCATGLALLTTVTSLSRLLASVLFGALWTWRGSEFAIVSFGGGLLVCGLAAAVIFRRTGVTHHARA